MKIISKLAAIALVLFGLVPAIAAGAQDCATEEYCADSGDQDAGGADNGGAGQADTGPNAVQPAAPARQAGGPEGGPAGGPVAAPSGALPITGSDVVGMAMIGAVAIALGGVLVLRSRQARPLASHVAATAPRWVQAQRE